MIPFDLRQCVGVMTLVGAVLLASCNAFAPASGGGDDASKDDAKTKLTVGQGEITIELPHDSLKVSRKAIVAYVKTAAEAVNTYLGQFPVKDLTVRVSGRNGVDVGGTEYDGKLIVLEIGADMDDAALMQDWVATHEMFHLAYPSLGDKYSWMNEGLSDYLEPVSRAGLGTISAEEAWRGFVEGMPQALPEAGDRGLDNTHTWARTYWGGCLYWLMADVRIRDQTHQRKTLADAVRAVLAAGGDGSVTWDISRVIAIGDRATGTTAMKDLHDELGPKPVKVDLDAFWKQLGVQYKYGRVTFNKNAPLASIRESITAVKKK
jgi:hypothetical protein